MAQSPWYRKTAEETFRELGTGLSGLHEKTAADKLESHGLNRLPEAKRVSRIVILLRQFASPLIYILLIAAAVTFVLAEYKDTIVIAAVLLFNAVIGFIQESRAEESVRALQKMIVPQARVVRESREKEISSEGLVPGDIVLLASGAKVPADIRLVAAVEMRIDESLLTGESVPAEKFADAIPESNLTPGDQRNIAFMGTVVVNGRGTGVVIETGARTVLGGIAHEIRETKAARAPLQEKFARFSNRIGLYVLAAAAALFGAGIAVGEPVRDMFMTVVPLAPVASEVTGQVTPQVTPEVTPQVIGMQSVLKGAMDRRSLQVAMGLKAEKKFRLVYLRPALNAGFIEMTHPDKPRSSKQKYRLTDKGRQALRERRGGGQ